MKLLRAIAWILSGLLLIVGGCLLAGLWGYTFPAMILWVSVWLGGFVMVDQGMRTW